MPAGQTRDFTPLCGLSDFFATQKREQLLERL
jgi:hypothetical protein